MEWTSHRVGRWCRRGGIVSREAIEGGRHGHRDSGGQQQQGRRKPTRPTRPRPRRPPPPILKERHEKLSEDVDSLLDEIDDVLEENAEEFVKVLRPEGWTSGTETFGPGA